MAGRKGHISLLRWKDAKLLTEFHVKELVRDVKFLHNELLFAVAQRKALYIYDSQGIEVHYLKSHIEPVKLEFLPYHFLLASVNNSGHLKYLDVSMGKQVAEFHWNFHSVCDMKANPWNAVICVADARGVVSMWTPNKGKPVVRLVCHNGPARALAIDHRGMYMATAGADNKMKIYDIRNLGEPVYDYWTPSPCSSLDISQTGLLSAACGSEVKIWKDWMTSKQTSPYMVHKTRGAVNDTSFVPYEDFLGIGHTGGFSNICIPGSGWANYDSYEANPYQTKRQRQEQEVQRLLEKLPPDTIMLNPNEIGTVDKASEDVIQAEEKAEREERERLMNEKKNKKKKNKMRSEESEGKKKTRVHDKKTREKIQQAMRDRKQDELEEKQQTARDISLLNTYLAKIDESSIVYTQKKRKVEDESL